jgi:surface protein
MKSLFQSCTNLTELDLSNFDISNVTNIEAIFAGCSNLTSLKLDNWNLLQSPSMGGMFQNATNLKELSLKNWTIPTSFHQILSADTSSTSTGSFLTAQLNWIDVSGWDLSQTTDIS